jgi:hypothetical protein
MMIKDGLKLSRIGSLAMFVALAGCSSILPARPVDPSRYASLGCVELNHEITETSEAISRTAITRGNVARTDIPGWVPGGRRVASAVIDRQTTRIERLQQQERAISSARAATCR